MSGCIPDIRITFKFIDHVQLVVNDSGLLFLFRLPNIFSKLFTVKLHSKSVLQRSFFNLMDKLFEFSSSSFFVTLVLFVLFVDVVGRRPYEVSDFLLFSFISQRLQTPKLTG